MLLAKPASNRLIVPHEAPNYPVVHIARWPRTLFDSHDAFVRLTEMYDSVMQAYIQEKSRDELIEWFVPHDDNDLSTPSMDITPLRKEDAVDWLERNFPFVAIPWLHRGDHTDIIWEVEDKFGGLIAFGDTGYLYVFAADLM